MVTPKVRPPAGLHDGLPIGLNAAGLVGKDAAVLLLRRRAHLEPARSTSAMAATQVDNHRSTRTC